jgi:hypothetical protein
VSWIANQPVWLLSLVLIAGLGVIVAVGRHLAGRFLRDAGPSAATVAGPLMPALGTAFAVLAAFAVANAALGLRDAEGDVGREATAAARLAWAASSAGAPGEVVLADLQSYLDSTLQSEWHLIDSISAGSGEAFDNLSALERSSRVLAAAEAQGTPQRSEILGAIDDLAAARRSRFSSAEPTASGLIGLLTLSAIALLINASLLTLGRERRLAAVLGSLVVVTAMSIATVIALGAPFSGSFEASKRPIADLAADLRANRFAPRP